MCHLRRYYVLEDDLERHYKMRVWRGIQQLETETNYSLSLNVQL